MNREDWIDANLAGKFNSRYGDDWSIIWGVTIWKLWKWRNEAIFRDGFTLPYNPAGVILHYISVIGQTEAAFLPFNSRRPTPIMIKWHPPEELLKLPLVLLALGD